MDEQQLTSFLENVRQIHWFSQAGEPHRNMRIVKNIQSGWDDENERMLEVWEPRTHALEAQAQSVIGDQRIDQIFSNVSDAIQDNLYRGLSSFLSRTYDNTTDPEKQAQESVDASLFPEVMESVKRDVCWAAIEHVLQVNGFFSDLLDLYRNGRWPCAWDGEYPKGRPVGL